MEVRNNFNHPKVAFKANLSRELQGELFKSARYYIGDDMTPLMNKVAKVKKWGHPSSVIETVIDFSDNAFHLSLFNKKLSDSYGASLPERGKSLLMSFLKLNENDIVKVEKEIQNISEETKFNVISKACEDDAFAEKITGKILPSNEELATAIDKLSEEELVSLRFGLDNCSENGKLIDFQV